jgi:intracellular septation protein A
VSASSKLGTGGVVVLEWYDFGRAEWAHVRDGVLDFVLGTLVPVGGFYVVYRLVSFQVAIIVVLAWAGGVFVWHYWRAHEFDVFSLTTMVLACVKATAGLASNDVRLYLVWPSVENLLYGTVFLGSAWLGRPVLAMYARRLYPIPPAVTDSDAFRHGFLVASLAWAAVSLMRAGMRVWLVATLPLGLFLAADAVIGWPMYLVLIWFSGWYPLRVLRRDGQVLP